MTSHVEAGSLATEQNKPTSTIWVRLLVVVTVVWGWTFVAIHDAVATMHPSTFVAYRFTCATLVLAIVLLPVLRGITATEVVGGVAAGCALFVAYALQTLGLQTTTPSNTAFITGMAVIFTPVFLLVAFRIRPHLRQVSSVLLATIGLALLTMRGFEVYIGDLLVLGCAVALTAHVIILSRVSLNAHSGRLTLIQLATVGVLGLSWSGLTGNVSYPATTSVWVALAVTAVVASAFAYLVQTKAQATASPTRIAVILTLEPVFGGLFGYWLAGDRFTTLNLIGVGLILAAMLITELRRTPKPQRSVPKAP